MTNLHKMLTRSTHRSHLFSMIHPILCLIVVFEAVHAQSCRPPKLDHGYFVPVNEVYENGHEITYACDLGHKPAVEGWWARSKCQHGQWAPRPKCIDEMACLDPVFSNAKLLWVKSDGFYEAGRYSYKCADGFEERGSALETECRNGDWTLEPTCEKSATSCGRPLKISNAVIMHDHHKEVFAQGSVLQFECEDSYTADGNKKMTCKNGQWTVSRQGIVSPPSGCELTVQEMPNPVKAVPGEVEQDGRTENVQNRGVTKDEGKCPLNGGACDAERSADVGATTFRKTDECGLPPSIQNAVIVNKFDTSIEFQCNEFYKLDGPPQVMCHSDRSWSTLPTCIEDYCIMPKTTALFSVQRDTFVKEQEKIKVPCISMSYYGYPTALIAMCDRGRMRYSHCVTEYNHQWEQKLIYGNEDILT